MKHIIIKNFGPLKDVEMKLSRINLIIGLQGSGKSCAMIIACFCSWVEKRIALRQSAKEFSKENAFLDMLVAYYHIKGYTQPDTYISYRSDVMSFSYDAAIGKFTHEWGRSHWRYRRPKVSYVPAERNMVSLVNNWSRLETRYENILDFYEDWDIARKYMKKESNILGTGISYEYDDVSGEDSIITPTNIRLDLTNSSSGMQSLIPQYVHMDYLYRGIYEAERTEKEKSFAEKQFTNNLLEIIYKRNFNKDVDENEEKQMVVVHKGGKDFVFHSRKWADQFEKETECLLRTDHAEIFLEEPECNLFPPTQHQLMNWILEMASDKMHRNFFFIATHSPYILNYLLQERLKSLSLFMTYSIGDGLFGIRSASEEDVQQVYDNGSDAFFNFDAILER